jgi:NAD(P)-dependent dehydrogenase (short-subunit alcohol dehydrogenase family)
MVELDGKSVLVTGATGILGKHFCRALAAHGAAVAVVDRDAEQCAEFASELTEEHGVRCVGIGCDIRIPAEVTAMAAQVGRELGSIDVLLNNAATKTDDLAAFFEPFESYSLETWREVMSVNLDGLFLVAQAVARSMIERGRGGSIIQTSSIYGVVAPDQRIYEGSSYLGRAINTPAVYSASKAGVLGLSRYLATYLAPHRIRVNTLTPGGVRSGQNDEFERRYSDRVPLGRMAEAEDLLGAVLFLASDSSTYVTGQNLVVDGGLTVW